MKRVIHIPVQSAGLEIYSRWTRAINLIKRKERIEIKLVEHSIQILIKKNKLIRN